MTQHEQQVLQFLINQKQMFVGEAIKALQAGNKAKAKKLFRLEAGVNLNIDRLIEESEERA